jgi:hypothetical protein
MRYPIDDLFIHKSLDAKVSNPRVSLSRLTHHELVAVT